VARCFWYVKAAGGDKPTVENRAEMLQSDKPIGKPRKATDRQKKEKDLIVRLKSVVGWG